MKQVTVNIGTRASRIVNANEYSVTPKTNEFKMTANGVECSAWSTSGKGKSVVNNHYLYWKEGKTLFWFKSDADEINAARTEGFRITDGNADKAPAGEQEPVTAGEQEQPAAPAKRVRVRK